MKIGIIGCGISGVSAARRMFLGNTEMPIEITLFDKGRSVAGRLSTKRVEKGGRNYSFDYGGQYWTISQPEFAAVNEELIKKDIVEEWKGHIGVIDRANKKAVLSQSNSSIKRYVGVGGNNNLVKALLEPMKSPTSAKTKINVVVNCKIDKITRTNQNKWDFIDEKGKLLETFDIAICTAPPIQTQAILNIQQNQSISKDFVETLQNATMKPCWALMIGYDRFTSLPFDAAFVNNSDKIYWMARNTRFQT